MSDRNPYPSPYRCNTLDTLDAMDRSLRFHRRLNLVSMAFALVGIGLSLYALLSGHGP